MDIPESLMTNFEEVIHDIGNEYERHRPEKGDSWKEISAIELKRKI